MPDRPLTPSGVAQIFVDAKGENTIGVAPGANACLEPGHIDRATGLFGPDTVVLLQLETPLETVSTPRAWRMRRAAR